MQEYRAKGADPTPDDDPLDVLTPDDSPPDGGYLDAATPEEERPSRERAIELPVVVRRKNKLTRKPFAPLQQVACTECTWLNLARYLIEGRCPNCNAHVEEFRVGSNEKQAEA